MISIRIAIEDDMPSIHSLVRELAVYEKAAEAVVTTPEEYLIDFRNGIFNAFVAETEFGEIVGTALFYIAYSTWKGKMLFLEDFVVKESYRRLGVGQLLFDAYIEEARRLRCRIVKWQVLDWNEPALNFYRRNNAIIETDWWNGKMLLTIDK